MSNASLPSENKISSAFKKFLAILKKLFTMKHSKLVCILFVIAIVASVLFANRVSIKNKLFGGGKVVAQRTAMVEKGDIKTLVSGSGPIYFTNDKILYSKVGATVTKVNFKEGDTVKAGDVIAEFDDSEVQTTVENNLLGLQQQQLAVQEDQKSLADLTVTVPFTGTVTGVSVNPGDSVQEGGKLFTVNDTSEFSITLNYNASDEAKIKVGQAATVYIASSMQSAKGTVTSISNTPTGTDSGEKAYLVTIGVPNPGALTTGLTASADISTPKGTVSSTNSSTLSYAKTQNVASKINGTVESVNVASNEKATGGSVAVTMESDELSNTLEGDQIKLSNMQQTYDQSEKQLEDYEVVAPFNGTITTLDYKTGDTVTAGAEIADVADTSSMEFDIAVDELDISKIAVGQPAAITLDALTSTTGDPLKGQVAKIAVSGTSSSGVTTYPVTVKITGSLKGIKGGMNANADITVSDENNVLYVPVDAVTTVGSDHYVWVRTGGTGGYGGRSGGASGFSGGSGASGGFSGYGSGAARRSSSSSRAGGYGGYGGYGGGGYGGGGYGGQRSANTNSEATVSEAFNNSASGANSSGPEYYDGAVRTKVEVGAENDTDVEIKSGLKQGQIVVMPQTTAGSTSSGTTTSGRTGGIGGMMGGGR